MPTMQELARVQISEQTFERNKLTPKRRRELKLESVLAYIRRKPYGERLKSKELMQFGFTSNAGADSYLKNLVRDGYVTKHELGLRSAFYTVDEPATVTSTPDREVTPPPVALAVSLEDQAMQFAWEHPLFNNDLREFVKWMKDRT